MAVYRLMYYLSKEQYIPEISSDTRDGIPVRTVILTSSTLLGVVIANYFYILDVGYMFSLAGQNFFLIYAISTASLFALSRRYYSRFISVVVICIVSTIFYSNSVSIHYPVAILGITTAIH